VIQWRPHAEVEGKLQREGSGKTTLQIAPSRAQQSIFDRPVTCGLNSIAPDKE
jgi:hypothetical protein